MYSGAVTRFVLAGLGLGLIGCAAQAHPSGSAPRASSAPVPLLSAPRASSALPSPSALPLAPSPARVTPRKAPVELPPTVPKPLAPLGPYQPVVVDVPDGCSASEILAASAPRASKDKPGWFWPSIVQALLAHDHVFQFVPDLKDATASARAVQFVELEDAGAPSPTLDLVVRCASADTCRDVLQVLRSVVPKSPAQFGCSNPNWRPTGRSVVTNKTELLAVSAAGQSAMPSDDACGRLSACARHEDAHADRNIEAHCTGSPRAFPLACAAQLTCYDVAVCAKLKSSAGPLFTPFSDLSVQVYERGVRIGRGLHVEDVGGGGGLDPAQLSQWVGNPDSDSSRGWATLLLTFQVSAFNQTGRYYAKGIGTWAVAFIQANGTTILGKPQAAWGTTYNAVGLPTAISKNPELFDFDGDGHAELLLPTSISAHANSGMRSYQVWTLRNDQIVRYPGTEALPIVAVEDADGDGRPDLVLDLQPMFDSGGSHSSIVGGTYGLAHSLKDGTFSVTDEVARNYPPSP